MADSNALSHAQTVAKRMQDELQRATQAFKSAHPDMFDKLKSMQETFATLPAPSPANDKWIPPNRQPSPGEPSSPRPATPPPSPLDAAMQAVQNMINLTEQQEAQLQQFLQRRQELVAKQQRVATLQHKLQAISQFVRLCRHCNHPLYIRLPDGTLEPCTRSNRFGCGYVKGNESGQKLLVGNLECIRRRNNAKGRRKYAARKMREQAGGTAPVLYLDDGKARPQ